MDPKKCIACLFLAAAAYGSNVGDTYQQVVAEKGTPKSQIEAGTLQILNYTDATVRLRNGIVVSVTRVNRPALPDTTPAPALAPAAKVAATEEELHRAVTEVQNIVNQAAPVFPRTPGMRVWEYEYWFHPGAEKPDFNTVDVRRTQEDLYANEDFVCLSAKPDVVWAGRDLEFNSMTKFFYMDRSIPKKRLTEAEMVQVNKLYRVIGRCEKELAKSGIQVKPSS
jgi:hypothetical protein